MAVAQQGELLGSGAARDWSRISRQASIAAQPDSPDEAVPALRLDEAELLDDRPDPLVIHGDQEGDPFDLVDLEEVVEQPLALHGLHASEEGVRVHEVLKPHDSTAGAVGVALPAGHAWLLRPDDGRTPLHHIQQGIVVVRCSLADESDLAHGALLGPPPRVVAEALNALTGAVALPRAQLYNVLRQTVERLARDMPLVLVIEDLHWADESTLDALAVLLSTTNNARWSLLGTYRDDELSLHPGPGLRHLLERLARYKPILRVNLDRLSPEEVADLSRMLSAGTIGRDHRQGSGSRDPSPKQRHTTPDRGTGGSRAIRTQRRTGASPRRVPGPLRRTFRSREEPCEVGSHRRPSDS